MGYPAGTACSHKQCAIPLHVWKSPPKVLVEPIAVGVMADPLFVAKGD